MSWRRAAIIAHIVGPTLGGWLCVNYEWQWIFLVNVPIGLVLLVGVYAVVKVPGYLNWNRPKTERCGPQTQSPTFASWASGTSP